MKLEVIKSGPWQIGINLVEFKEGQVLVVGEDVPDKVAEDMLRCDYAIPKQDRRIETKKADVESTETKEDKPFDIDTASPDELEAFARKELGIELDKRLKLKKLRNQVKEALKEKNNE